MVKHKKQWWITGGILLLLLTASGSGSLLWWRDMDTMPEVTIPSPKMPSPNAYDFYVKAGKAVIPPTTPISPLYDSKFVPENQRKTHYPVAKKEAWLKQNAHAFSLLEKGFALPCRVPPQRSYISTIQGHGSKIWHLVNMIILENEVHVERGQRKQAAESGLKLIKLGHELSRGATLTDTISGAQRKRTGNRIVWKQLPSLNATETQEIFNQMEKLFESRVKASEIWQEEKYFGQARSLEIMQMEGWRTANWTGKKLQRRLYWLYRLHTSSKRSQFDSYTRYLDAWIAYSKKPYLNDSPKPAQPNDLFSHLHGAFYSRIPWHYARDESGGALLLTALALRLYHHEHKRYPQTLNELSPRYLKQIPVDPFGDGSPLRYKINGDKYLLYSIGPDGKDDGGRAIEDAKYPKERRARYAAMWYSKGDFVAGISY